MEQTKKLFLLDAFALIYRSYFAFSRNPRLNSRGLNTSSIFGFTNTLVEILSKENPTHLAVVFDTPSPTFRHQQFSAYKANRQEMPEDIKLSIPYIKKIIKAFNIPVLFKEGFEADDVIGTLAKKAEKQNFKTYMMTPDKDFGQLVSDKIFMYKPGKFGKPAEILGKKEVCDKFGIQRVDQVVDMLGMMGDSVDNIPGIPGVGEKTAQKLLFEFNTLEEVLNNAELLKGKLKEKVIEGKDSALLSKHLATIAIDVPIDFNDEEMKVKRLNKQALQPIFEDLEFRSIQKRLFENLKTEDTQFKENLKISIKKTGQFNLFEENVINAEAVSKYKTIKDVETNYYLIDTLPKRKKLLQDLLLKKEVSFDTETTGLDIVNDEIIGISFSYKKGEGYYIPLYYSKRETTAILQEFVSFFESDKIQKIGQNIKYDIQVLSSYNIVVKGPVFDTMIAHYLLYPDMRHNMNFLSETYLKYSPISIESLIGKKGVAQKKMQDIEIDKMVDYAVEDADVTFQLKGVFCKMLEEHEIDKLFSDLEMPLVNVLSKIELNGVKLDIQFLENFAKELKQEILSIETKIKNQAGVDFNLASPKQLGNVLFEHLKLNAKAKKTKTGQYATSEEVLLKLAKKHSIVSNVLDWRSVQKLKSTYVDALPQIVNKKTRRIHTSYNQAIAATGRLSSTNPNLQNIPIRTLKGREVRKAFVPSSSSHTLLAADYSQIELRLMAELSKDVNMFDDFKEDKDIHAATASRVYGVKMDSVSRDMRSNAKMVNFGIIYGISAFGLSQRLGIARKEASEIIEQYFKMYPLVKEYMHKSIELAREKGFVKTIMGRKRILKDINSKNAVIRGHAERNAINAPIQGSAADVIKIAMINIQNQIELQKLNSKMILQVHDELVFDVDNNELETVKNVIKNQMENAVMTKVKLKVDIGLGKNWLEAH